MPSDNKPFEEGARRNAEQGAETRATREMFAADVEPPCHCVTGSASHAPECKWPEWKGREGKRNSVADFDHLSNTRQATGLLVALAEAMQMDGADLRTREAAAIFRMKVVAAWHDSGLKDLFWESRHNTALVHFKPKERPSL